MKFITCILVVIVLFISGLSFFIGISLAQDNLRGSIIKFESVKEMEKEKIIQRAKEDIDRFKASLGITRLYSYKAAVMNSSSACDVLKGSKNKECLEEMGELRELYKHAVGKCNVSKGKFKKRMCKALRNGNCQVLYDKNDVLSCKGFLNLDPQFIEKSLKEEINEGELDAKDYEEGLRNFLRELAYYAAFKTNRALTCIQLLESVPYFRKVGCYILTSDFPQKIIDRYALDFSYYYHSMKSGNQDICEEIEDFYIKRFCDVKVNFSIFIQEYFLHSKE